MARSKAGNRDGCPTEKAVTVNDLKGRTVAFAASGGLDSCTVTKWLTEHGVTVVCFTADMAQPDETDFAEIEKRMRLCGARRLHRSRSERLDRRGRPGSHPVASVLRGALLEHDRHRPARHRRRHGAGDAREGHQHPQPRRHRPRQRSGALSALHQHARSGLSGLRPVARRGVSQTLRRPQRDDRLLPRTQAADQGEQGRPLFHRCQPARPDA